MEFVLDNVRTNNYAYNVNDTFFNYYYSSSLFSIDCDFTFLLLEAVEGVVVEGGVVIFFLSSISFFAHNYLRLLFLSLYSPQSHPSLFLSLSLYYSCRFDYFSILQFLFLFLLLLSLSYLCIPISWVRLISALISSSCFLRSLVRFREQERYRFLFRKIKNWD